MRVGKSDKDTDTRNSEFTMFRQTLLCELPIRKE